MKLRTYAITFTAFSMAQALRICFSFNKHEIQQRYNVNDLFLGIMDFFYCLMYSLGACFHFSIIKRNSIKQTYLKIAILSTITGSFYAFYSMFIGDSIFSNQTLDNMAKKGLLILNISLFGFSQFAVWPLNLTLVSQYYKPETDGSMIGLWSSAWEVGNIVCLGVSNLLIHSFHVKWELTVLFFALSNFVCAFLMNLFLQNPKSSQEGPSEITPYTGTQITPYTGTQITLDTGTQRNLQVDKIPIIQKKTPTVNQRAFYQFTKELIKSKQIRIYMAINGLTSGIFITFLYWIPIYMTGLGREDIAGYMTVAFEVAAILGSFFFGIMHQNKFSTVKTSLLRKAKQILSQYLPFVSTLINFIAMICWISISENISVYAILVGISGFFMGGLYNSMHSNDLFEYTRNDPIKTEMFAVVILITNYVCSSVISLVVSVIIEYGRDLGLTDLNQIQYKSIFYVLIVITGLDFVLFMVKKINSQKKSKDKTSLF